MALITGPAAADDAAFPEVKAQNLEGKLLSLPSDFTGEYNLLLVAFDRDQQADVDTWVGAMPDLLKGHNNVSYYEIPTIAKEYKLIRFVIDRAMKSGVPAEQRARTITLYIDRTPFEKALKIQDENRISVLLVDRKGKVVWREEGLYYDIKGNSFKLMLNKLTGAPAK